MMDTVFRVTQISSSIANDAIRRPLPAIAMVGALTLLGWGSAAMRSNYLEWKAMGRGGAPYNVYGWTLQHVLDLAMGQDTSRLDYYDKPLDGVSEEAKERAQRRFLPDLPERKGPESKALPFCIPQRERHAGTVPGMIKAQTKLFEDIAAANGSIIIVRQSILEKVGPAMFLPENTQAPEVAFKTGGEICHIHDSDGSSHVSLSNADSKEVLSKGWGERHRLSGRYLHLGYTMLYAPRDEEEVEIMGKLFKAGIAFMTGGKEVV